MAFSAFHVLIFADGHDLTRAQEPDQFFGC